MHKPTHIFDDFDALRQDGEQLVKKQKKAGNRRARSDETFARIFHDRVRQLCGHVSATALFILFELDWLILTSKGQNPVMLTNQRLYNMGISRSAKSNALRQLEKAKVIKVERQERKAVLVTHLWFEISAS